MRSSWLLALLVAIGSGGCGYFESKSTGREIPPLAPLPAGETAVRLKVIRGGSGGTVALTDVYINDQGPFSFVVDTGASHSIVEKSIARRLGLPESNEKIETIGVQSIGQATPILVEKWRVGDIELPRMVASEIDMPQADRSYRLEGLLGSDVLSRFGQVSIDYDGQLLVLRPGRKVAEQ